jgi:hypothetical protein
MSNLVAIYGRSKESSLGNWSPQAKHALLVRGSCLYALHATIRSSLHRCLQRHGISRLPEVTGDKEPKRKFKTYPID